MWRLWLADKLNMGDFDQISFDTADLAGEALDAWRAAEARANAKAQR